MDNKKWYKRFGTVFWWFLTILPIVTALIYFIGYHLTFNSGISSASDLTFYHNSYKYFSLFFDNTFKSQLGSFIPSFISSSINQLFITLFGYDSPLLQAFCLMFSWSVWVQLIHLFFDIVCWLPNWCHSLMCKFGGE